MTKKELIADIRAEAGNVLTTKAVGKYLGLCPHATRDFLAGVPRFEIGRKKCVFAVDLANRILAGQE